MKRIITGLCVLFFSSSWLSGHTQTLQDSLVALCQGVTGQAGVYVKDLRTGKTWAYQENIIFPTASMVKIPIMIGVMDQIRYGNLSYHQPLEFKDSLLYAGEDILGSFKDGEKIALDKVMMLMLTMSDNTASLWLQHLAGTGSHINALMEDYGMEYTRMNSRTPGRREDWERYGWGQTTPREMATLMEKIWRLEIVSPEASERMLRNLKRNYWDTEALLMLPPHVNIFSKNGAVSASRSEVVLVNARHSDYVFCVMTNGLEDTSWEYENEGWQLIRSISDLLYRHFEPSDDWRAILTEDATFR